MATRIPSQVPSFIAQGQDAAHPPQQASVPPAHTSEQEEVDEEDEDDDAYEDSLSETIFRQAMEHIVTRFDKLDRDIADIKAGIEYLSGQILDLGGRGGARG